MSEFGANLVVYADDLGPNGPGASQPRKTGAISSQDITINSNSTRNFDASQSGYNQYIFKIMLHELGHVFGLDDVNWGDSCLNHAYASIMDQICGVPNDWGQGISTVIGPGDDLEIINIYGFCLADNSCQSDNGCSGYDASGYPIRNPDSCANNPAMGYGGGGCPSGSSLLYEGGNPGMGCCIQDESPIIVDLTGDGFGLTDPQRGVTFDLDGSGSPHQYSWTATNAENGWLALDRNGNGMIDSGVELFGNHTPQPPSHEANGFLALSVYDQPKEGGNGNGEIDPGDAIYSKLRIWIDRNHNGISEPDELYSLRHFKIASISLRYRTSKWTDQYGNAFRYKARVRITDVPSDRWTYDVFLRRGQ